MAKKQFQPNSLYVRYDKNSKLWIQVRKRNYLYWYKFLQICLRENYKINKKKYVGWDLDTILDTKFDDWWKSHWKKLFGIKQRSDTPLYSVSTSRIKTQSIRLSLLVHQYKHVGNNFDVSEKIQLVETAKRYPTHFHFPRKTEILNNKRYEFYNRDYISKQIGVLKGRFKKTITNVCNGTFP